MNGNGAAAEIRIVNKLRLVDATIYNSQRGAMWRWKRGVLVNFWKEESCHCRSSIRWFRFRLGALSRSEFFQWVFLLGFTGILLVYVILIKGLRLKTGTLRGYVLIFFKTATLYYR